MQFRVWTDCGLAPEPRARLSEMAEVVQGKTLEELPGADAVIIASAVAANGDFMDRAGPSLKVIARHGVGYDNVDVPAATARGILVINTPDAVTEPTAEHGVALLLALARRVVAGNRKLRGEEIAPTELRGRDVRGEVLGIVGLGRIGRRIAEICGQGFKMDVIAYDPYADSATADALGVRLIDSLDTLLQQADWVSLNANVTPETKGLMKEERLRRMKAGACLLNVGRGALVDEAALIRVLQDGHLGGAALDVFDPEPPSPDNPLLHMPNVVATPHSACATGLCMHDIASDAVNQLLQVFRGERPTSLVNPDVWPGRVAAGGR